MSSDVMNNNDLKRYILSFLRKKAKLYCYVCKKVLIWDKKVREPYYVVNCGESICQTCHRYEMRFLTWSGT